MNQTMILPPSCIGIMGGGQLGMMLANVARQNGYKVAILEPDKHCPASNIVDYHIVSEYTDKQGLLELAKLSAVITTEFENVPALAIEFLAKHTLVYPANNALLIAQNRLKEKQFFQSLSLDVVEFVAIDSMSDCEEVTELMFPAILKTVTLGYDGKGQKKVNNKRELLSAYNQLNQSQCILEKTVNLVQELSVIVARNSHGCKVYCPIENQHINGILDISFIPAQIETTIANLARQVALTIVEKLNYIGLLTVEFFITNKQQLLVNEIAPRPHNSGHITIDVCETSQFEQQLRAICGLPLGDTRLKEHGAMLNLLGDIWLNNQSNPFNKILTNPKFKLHYYGKEQAKFGRKMGHLSISGSDHLELASKLEQLKRELLVV